MSWAPAAGAMKRDCCVLAPDLRGHGLTSSTNTDAEDGTAAGNTDAADGDHDDGDDDRHAEDGSDDGYGEDGADALMSLESLAEDVTSLLVEIFTRGLLSQPRQQQQQQPDQHPLHPEPAQVPSIPESIANSGKTPASSYSISSNEGSNPTSGSAATVGEDPPPRDVAEANEEISGGDGTCESSRATGARASSSPSAAASPEVLQANPIIRLLLVGHSLGGSIAVRVAGAAEELKRRCHGTAEVAGLVAVDVVEGTALASLDDMPEVREQIYMHIRVYIYVDFVKRHQGYEKKYAVTCAKWI